jgi:hypothetical protein
VELSCLQNDQAKDKNGSHQHAVYFIAEMVRKSTEVARFKHHHGLTVTCSEVGNKNIPLSVSRQFKTTTPTKKEQENSYKK